MEFAPYDRVYSRANAVAKQGIVKGLTLMSKRLAAGSSDDISVSVQLRALSSRIAVLQLLTSALKCAFMTFMNKFLIEMVVLANCGP